MLQCSAYAKLNLTLDITGRDARGYHLLSSVFAEISLADEVTLIPEGETLTLSCNLPGIPTDGKNLCVKAAEAFFRETKIPKAGFRILLEKRIPSCAGLGGGSSDGAAVLKLLCSHYGISPEAPEIFRAALSVGADVPFFLRGGVCLAEGIGERLMPLQKLPRYYVLVAKTADGASTPEVYRAFDSMGRSYPCTTPGFLSALQSGNSIAPYVSNHLTAATATLCPSVNGLKQRMLLSGALASEMSGSGSAVYGLFSDEQTARNAKMNIGAAFCEICRFV